MNDSVDGMRAEGLGLAHQSFLGAMPKKSWDFRHWEGNSEGF